MVKWKRAPLWGDKLFDKMKNGSLAWLWFVWVYVCSLLWLTATRKWIDKFTAEHQQQQQQQHGSSYYFIIEIYEIYCYATQYGAKWIRGGMGTLSRYDFTILVESFSECRVNWMNVLLSIELGVSFKEQHDKHPYAPFMQLPSLHCLPKMIFLDFKRKKNLKRNSLYRIAQNIQFFGIILCARLRFRRRVVYIWHIKWYLIRRHKMLQQLKSIK